MKFGRTYKMTVEGENQTHEINFPLTMTFDIVRNTLASANTARIVVYNLKKTSRRDIYKDRWETTIYRQIKLQAGYEGEPTLPVIFQGNIQQAFSYRSGPDWLTELDCFDGGHAIMNGQVNTTLAAGWNVKQALQATFSALKVGRVDIGSIGDFPVQASRGLTLAGNAWDKASRLVAGGVTYIDNEKANALQKDEFIDTSEGLAVISSATGLLNAPRRQNATIEIDMIFEPRLIIGQILDVKSIETVNNGSYQAIGVKHKGTISGAVGGSAVTTATLWLGTRQLRGVTP